MLCGRLIWSAEDRRKVLVAKRMATVERPEVGRQMPAMSVLVRYVFSPLALVASGG